MRGRYQRRSDKQRTAESLAPRNVDGLLVNSRQIQRCAANDATCDREPPSGLTFRARSAFNGRNRLSRIEPSFLPSISVPREEKAIMESVYAI